MGFNIGKVPETNLYHMRFRNPGTQFDVSDETITIPINASCGINDFDLTRFFTILASDPKKMAIFRGAQNPDFAEMTSQWIDEFNGTAGDPFNTRYWQMLTNSLDYGNGDYAQLNGAGEFHISTNGHTYINFDKRYYPRYDFGSRFLLEGDFDVEVWIDHYNSGSSAQCGFQVRDVPYTGYANSYKSSSGSYLYFYVNDSEGYSSGYSNVSSTGIAFRIRRVGDVLQGDWYRGGWRGWKTYNWETYNPIQLRFWSHSTSGTTMRTEIRNFKVTFDTVIPNNEQLKILLQKYDSTNKECIIKTRIPIINGDDNTQYTLAIDSTQDANTDHIYDMDDVPDQVFDQVEHSDSNDATTGVNRRIVIPTSELTAFTGKVRIQFQYSGTSYTLNDFYIYEQASTGDAFDAETGTGVQVTMGGSTSFTVQPGSVLSDPIDFDIDALTNILLVFHHDGRCYKTSLPTNCLAWYKVGVTESTTVDVTGYITETDFSIVRGIIGYHPVQDIFTDEYEAVYLGEGLSQKEITGKYGSASSDGTLNTSAMVGNGIDTDGSTEQITVPHALSPHLTEDFSVIAAFDADSSGVQEVHKWNAANTAGWGIQMLGTNLFQAGVRVDASFYHGETSDFPVYDGWNLCGFNYAGDGSDIELFLHGGRTSQTTSYDSGSRNGLSDSGEDLSLGGEQSMFSATDLLSAMTSDEIYIFNQVIPDSLHYTIARSIQDDLIEWNLLSFTHGYYQKMLVGQVDSYIDETTHKVVMNDSAGTLDYDLTKIMDEYVFTWGELFSAGALDTDKWQTYVHGGIVPVTGSRCEIPMGTSAGYHAITVYTKESWVPSEIVGGKMLITFEYDSGEVNYSSTVRPPSFFIFDTTTTFDTSYYGAPDESFVFELVDTNGLNPVTAWHQLSRVAIQYDYGRRQVAEDGIVIANNSHHKAAVELNFNEGTVNIWVDGVLQICGDLWATDLTNWETNGFYIGFGSGSYGTAETGWNLSNLKVYTKTPKNINIALDDDTFNYWKKNELLGKLGFHHVERWLPDNWELAEPPAYSGTYVKATGQYLAAYNPEYSIDPALPLTGAYTNNQWLGPGSTPGSLKWNVDLGTAVNIKKIRMYPSHNSGANTNTMIRDFTIYGTNSGTAFSNTTYSNTDGLTELVQLYGWQKGEGNQGWFEIDLPDNDLNFRYMVLRIHDGHGWNFIGFRRIQFLKRKHQAIININTDLVDYDSSRFGIDYHPYKKLDDKVGLLSDLGTPILQNGAVVGEGSNGNCWRVTIPWSTGLLKSWWGRCKIKFIHSTTNYVVEHLVLWQQDTRYSQAGYPYSYVTVQSGGSDQFTVTAGLVSDEINFRFREGQGLLFAFEFTSTYAYSTELDSAILSGTKSATNQHLQANPGSYGTTSTAVPLIAEIIGETALYEAWAKFDYAYLFNDVPTLGVLKDFSPFQHDASLDGTWIDADLVEDETGAYHLLDGVDMNMTLPAYYTTPSTFLAVVIVQATDTGSPTEFIAFEYNDGTVSAKLIFNEGNTLDRTVFEANDEIGLKQVVTTGFQSEDLHAWLLRMIESDKLYGYVDGSLINSVNIGTFTEETTVGRKIGSARDDTQYTPMKAFRVLISNADNISPDEVDVMLNAVTDATNLFLALDAVTVPNQAYVDLPYWMYYTENRLAFLDELYHLYNNFNVFVDLVYGIKLGNHIDQFYGDNPTVTAYCDLPYASTHALLSYIDEHYGDTRAVLAYVDEHYDIKDFLGLVSWVDENYAIAGDSLKAFVDQLYGLLANNPRLSFNDLLYGILAESVVEESTIEVYLDGTRVYPFHITYEYDLEQFTATGEIHTNSAEEFRMCREFETVLEIVDGAEHHYFTVEVPRRLRAPGEVTYVIPASSKSYILDKSPSITKEYPAGLASALAESVAVEYDLTLDWQGFDYYLPAGTVYANNETPIEVIRRIADAVRNVVQSDMSGNLYIIEEAVETVDNWDSATPAYTLDDAKNFFSTEETFEDRDGYNKFNISDHTLAEDREWIESEDSEDNKIKFVKAYKVPYEAPFSNIKHSSENAVSVDDLGSVTDTIEEEVQIKKGEGKTRYPIYSIVSQTLDELYSEVNLGPIEDWTEDGAVYTTIKEQSLMNIKYVTKYRKQEYSAQDVRSVQVYLEKD